jgi:hypothetical protein
MKTYVKFSMLLLSISALISFISCTENISTKSEDAYIEFSSYQISGCNSSPFSKVSENDSCFDYSFDDTLKIDFCVTGNCCPDSQRFVSYYNIKSDTLFVSVVDTASRLCHCICNYKIHLELLGLTNEQYIFYCNYGDVIEYKELMNK